MFELMKHQQEAIAKLDTGKILVGGVGSGKSITSLMYYIQKAPERPIIVITTAKKRDSGDWYSDLLKTAQNANLTVDSWNNIGKYVDEENKSFIFDEQRLVGSGAWVKSFYKIAAQNDWILLSATPADTWLDLIPIFVANGFHDNRTSFFREHVVFSRYAKYPKVDRYLDVEYLEAILDQIMVEMPYLKEAVREDHLIKVPYDVKEQYTLLNKRFNEAENKPIQNVAELIRLLRKSTNTHSSRLEVIYNLFEENPRLIIYYTHNYELEILRSLGKELLVPLAEWNGHKHEDIPDEDSWIYLVQYHSGSEGWNCTSTDTIVFYSLPYSYRQLEQAKGRIDRLNTTYPVLHYYILKSDSRIDQSIWQALSRKKNFNKSMFKLPNPV